MESVWWRLNMQIHGGWLTNYSLEKMAAILQMIFSDKFLYFDYNFIEVCSQGSN